MKKKDIILILGLCIVIGIGYLIFNLMQGDKEIVEVYYQNKVIDQIDLSVNKTYTYKGSYGTFHLEVKDEKYHATNVECPNHDCEKVGWVKKGSTQTITCVPNEIYVLQTGVEDQY